MSSVAISPPSHNLKDWFGRGQNNRSELYKLPADKKEMDRLSLQHRIWKLMVGGLYPTEAEEAVIRALCPDNESTRSEPPSILDIGSGSGAWAIEVAQRFPYARVIGIDLAECTPSFVPSNCSFRVADATKGLDEYEGAFSVVHCRSVAGHVADPVGLTRAIGRFLKPGGIFISADANKHVYTPEKQHCRLASTEVSASPEGGSWLARWMYEVTSRWTSKGHMHTQGDKLGTLIRNDGQFDLKGERAYWSPINWDGEDIPDGYEIGQLMVLNWFDFLQSCKPALLSAGLSETIVESWVQNAQKEAMNPSNHLYMKWVVAWATKRRGD